MMHPALIKLLTLRLRGALRRMVRGIKSPRGALFFAMGAFVLVAMLGPNVVFGALARGESPEKVRTFAPLFLLGFCVLTIVSSGGQRGVTFSPAEVDFLFAGPFTRRELIAYRLSLTTLGVLVTALLLSVVFLRHASWWPAAYVGLVLALVFIQLVSTSVVLVGVMLGERAYTRGRRIVLAAVLLLVVAGVMQGVQRSADLGAAELVRSFRRSWPGHVLLPVFDVFARAFTAATARELLQWSVPAAVIDLILFGLVIKLDANYLEAALATSRRNYDRLQRVRSGGMASAWQLSATARWRPPRPGWLGGAGPVMWRQMTIALRSSGALLMLVLLLGMVTLPMWMLSRGGVGMVGPFLGIAIAATFYVSMMVPFDFRRDLDHLDWLKALPLRPAALVMGQLVTPVALLVLLQSLLLCAVATMSRDSRHLLLVAAAYLVPFNFLMIAGENLIFLLFPTRLAAPTPGDVQFLGRQMLVMFLKFVLLLACCGIAGVVGGVAYWVAGHSWAALVAASWLALSVLALCLVPAVAWAFERFDPSVDTPA